MVNNMSNVSHLKSLGLAYYLSHFKAKCGIVNPMKKSLLETNPYLKDPTKREEATARNIETSSAIEGIWVKRDAVTGQFVHTNDINPLPKAKQTSRSRH
jgi:hypothetical protein